MSTEWYKRTAEQTLQEIGTTNEKGLTTAEATSRLEKYGPNELEEKAGRSALEILWEQFANILTVLLILAAVVSMVLGDWVEAVAILVIVVLNGVLGYTQEARAEQSMAALKKMSVPTVRVRRDGRLQEISARNLVPGDIVVLETGNIIPADGRVTASVNLRVEEAALTGESEPVDKDPSRVFEEDRALGDRRNMVYSGTLVNYGRGEFVVTDTGMATELGHIANLIQGVEEESTPLQQRLHRLGQVLAWAAIVLVIAVVGLGIWREMASGKTFATIDFPELLLTGVSLAVAAIPEALTAVVTIALSLGAQRMLKRHALIRRLPAVETLGSVTVICSDKTGTLTLNRMTVQALDMANHSYRFSYSDKTSRLELEPTADNDSTTNPTLDLLLIGGSLNSDATIDEADDTKVIGDPTEAALVSAAALVGMHKAELETAFPRVAEVPFDSVRKRMTTLHSVPESSNGLPDSLVTIWERQTMLDHNNRPDYVAFTKGAIDGLLAISPSVWVDGKIQPLDEAWKKRIMASHDEMAAKGMRVLGVALRPWDSPPDETTEEALEQDLILLGMVGMIDPPRPEVKDAVANCKAAGIRPVMITGDHPLTARHIAQQIGISDKGRFITGQELDHISPSELEEKIKDISVFARVSPEHKIRLVEVLQGQNNIVAMTGDGVNDAPALKRADIGVAMGITGTDVAKGAAEMVLLDDNFATIVAAVEEGRVIYDNIRRFIKYLLTCNVSEIAVMLIAPFLGMPLPLFPLQILWMNLVTDGLPALALGIEPPESDVMKRPPYSATESVFGRGMPTFIVVFGVVLSILALVTGFGLWESGDPAWRTVLFSTLVFAQLGMALSVRSERESLLRTGLLTNKAMLGAIIITVVLQLILIYWGPAQQLFHTEALTTRDLLICFGVGMSVIVLVEIWKVFARARAAKE
ncbi:MAG TPA: cation-translocating P-type ATPase [Promineifilum sp.]|nr:cation-translocating P-type ATPase [Promineifilum sp.]HRO91257.1 cation-translocating P-type ATPase [Promineifilum sp.]HRQ13799.1 cation-translocating P-type ATPase [Promineifilum sp.]